jgi:hypothetical protein
VAECGLFDNDRWCEMPWHSGRRIVNVDQAHKIPYLYLVRSDIGSELFRLIELWLVWHLAPFSVGHPSKTFATQECEQSENFEWSRAANVEMKLLSRETSGRPSFRSPNCISIYIFLCHAFDVLHLRCGRMTVQEFRHTKAYSALEEGWQGETGRPKCEDNGDIWERQFESVGSNERQNHEFERQYLSCLWLTGCGTAHLRMSSWLPSESRRHRAKGTEVFAIESKDSNRKSAKIFRLRRDRCDFLNEIGLKSELTNNLWKRIPLSWFESVIIAEIHRIVNFDPHCLEE